MKKQLQHPRAELPISLEQYQQLAGASIDSAFRFEPWEIAAMAIREWLVRHSPDTLADTAKPGYQWKQIFLPSGTLLRTNFSGKNYHGLVEEDRILYEGKSVSPSGFANVVGGMRRNAWKVVWILFPDTSTWRQADTLRDETRRRRA